MKHSCTVLRTVHEVHVLRTVLRTYIMYVQYINVQCEPICCICWSPEGMEDRNNAKIDKFEAPQQF